MFFHHGLNLSLPVAFSKREGGKEKGKEGGREGGGR